MTDDLKEVTVEDMSLPGVVMDMVERQVINTVMQMVTPTGVAIEVEVSILSMAKGEKKETYLEPRIIPGAAIKADILGDAVRGALSQGT